MFCVIEIYSMLTLQMVSGRVTISVKVMLFDVIEINSRLTLQMATNPVLISFFDIKGINRARMMYGVQMQQFTSLVNWTDEAT